MNKKLEIGAKLKEFAKKKFGSIAALERELNKPAAYFQNYINGRSYLGGDILCQLSELGCDINWLLTGEKGDKHIIKEPEGQYNMGEYTNLFAEVHALREEIKEYKIMIFDLQRANERLTKENKSLTKTNTELKNELIEIQKQQTN
jgi:hypothetical protein